MEKVDTVFVKLKSLILCVKEVYYTVYLTNYPDQENVPLHFGNLDFDVRNFEQLFLLYGQLSL